MRATSRLLAEIAKKPASQYLLAYAPTGLTGLLTHPFPRPTLISLYTQTLQKLAAFPSNSVYRTSVEALCKQRLGFVTAQVPPGYAEWEQKVNAIMQSHPEIAKGRSVQVEGKTYLLPKEEEGNVDDRTMEAEWEGDEEVEDRGEGPRTAGERRYQAREVGEGRLVQEFERDIPKVPNEPPMTRDQYVEREYLMLPWLIIMLESQRWKVNSELD